ncbi:NACHT domain-containing protein [Streptomyces sp. NPDC086023]|uniref:NACHT domain-containing protein n=1 Tax=Streptomyces sp. NPDC086023 TaxID=3365746 RepID=UPI0037CD331D
MGERDTASGFAEELRTLYEAAGGGADFGLKYLVSLGKKHGCRVADSTISGWLKGPSVPTEQSHVGYVLRHLIPHLEALAADRSTAHRRTSPEGWQSRLHVAQQVRKSRQGGRGPRVHAESPGRLHGHPEQIRQSLQPRDFVGREQELADLWAHSTAPVGQGPDYLYLQAGPWAGKSALLAWFADDRHLPAGVEAVPFFIARRLGTDNRAEFLRVITEQLAAVAGERPPAAGKRNHEQLDRLYEAAAQACRDRGRRLLLVVDGLDEDAEAGPGRESIAALLPKNPPAGMRVIVSGRPNPTVPEDVLADHPLRDRAVMRPLSPSPAARIVRDTATKELNTLLEDRGLGSALLGLLTVARGALSGSDLATLAGAATGTRIRPYEVDRQLRSVVGRSMAPDDSYRLTFGTDGDPGRQMYVLAHDELRVAATQALGDEELAEYRACLRAWADGYRSKGWPTETPDYLLTGYTRFVQGSGDVEHLAALVLDPHRQLRLVARSAVDIALSDLDLAVAAHPDTSPRSLAVLAGAAVSREFLFRDVRALPRSVPRAVARLGDARRARDLARVAPFASERAAALADVARVLASIGHEQARETALEATEWARRAYDQARPIEGDGDDAESVAAPAAVALIATGQPEVGLRLLRSTRGPHTKRYEAWAEAARVLAPDDPEEASALLDELEEEAGDFADGHESGTPHAHAVAFQIWGTVAAACPERAERLRDRIRDHARAVWAASPTLANIGVLSSAASTLADPRPDEAAALAREAEQHVRTMFRHPESLPARDRAHLVFGAQLTLRALAQALIDTGSPLDEVRRLLDSVPEEFRVDRTGLLGSEIAALARAVLSHAESPESPDSPAERLADEAFRLAESGSDHEARQLLDEAMRLLPGSSPARRARLWAPALAGALVRLDRHTAAQALAEASPKAGDRCRAHAAMSLAYTDSGSERQATEQAQASATAAYEALDDGDALSYNAWAFAAQALACAGEGDAALELVEQSSSADRARRVEWSTKQRRARIAVADALVRRDPVEGARLVDEERAYLLRTSATPRRAGLLAGLAALMPAAARAERPCRERFDQAVQASFAYTQGNPETWDEEAVLVHALLRTGAGEDADGLLDWLEQTMRRRRPEHFPTAGLALLHVVRGDVDRARHVAAQLGEPRQRAQAFAAVAAHLADVSARPAPSDDLPDPDPFIHVIRSLAQAVAPLQAADQDAAAAFVREALGDAGWYHALEVLPHIAPEAIVRILDIALAHLRIDGSSP